MLLEQILEWWCNGLIDPAFYCPGYHPHHLFRNGYPITLRWALSASVFTHVSMICVLLLMSFLEEHTTAH